MEHVKYGLSAEYWSSLSDKEKDIYRLIQPLPRPEGVETIAMSSLKRKLSEFDEDTRSTGGSFNLTPDFQRCSNCWTEEQQVSYIENLFRGVAPTELKFNSDNWCLKDSNKPENIVCIDGLQRITAILLFLEDDLAIFDGKVKASDLIGTTFSPKMFKIQIKMYNFEKRKELLEFYVKLNSGGTIHSKEEIEKVKNLISEL